MKINATSLYIDKFLEDNRTYFVPLFQRGYSWGKKGEVVEFWEDILSIYDGKTQEGYFIGSMVFIPEKSNSKVKILDGQQRLSTIMIFFTALKDYLKGQKYARAKQWSEAYERVLRPRDKVTMIQHLKLELNKEDKNFFENLTINGSSSKAKKKSHKLMNKAYDLFISELKKKGNEKFIERILEIITKKLYFINIEVDSDVNAHQIFETLNDRGLELTIADLTKNYLLSLALEAGKDIEEASESWQEIIDQVGDEKVSKFLRHFWLSNHGMVTKEDLYKKIKEEVKNHNVLKFLKELTFEAAIYGSLINPNHEYWGDKKTEKILLELKSLNVDQVYSILLAISRKYEKNKKELNALLNLFLNFTFRYSTVCGKNPNSLERIYSKLSNELRNGKINPNKLKREIDKISPREKEFIACFESLEIKNAKIAKYILYKIEDFLSKIEDSSKEHTPKKEVINLEHIIPKRPNKEWKEFLEKNKLNHSELLFKIGNLTLLLDEYNKNASNSYFTIKKNMYLKSRLCLNKELKNFEQFSEKELMLRQSKIGKLAEKIWST
ncbi:DUF262 domain-containing protein [Nanoarchaeota archaeon]